MTTDKTRGLYEKFTVVRTDGRSAAGEKHHDCDYFVLDLTHDPHALTALAAYADSCLHEYPALAADLNKKLQGREAADERVWRDVFLCQHVAVSIPQPTEFPGSTEPRIVKCPACSVEHSVLAPRDFKVVRPLSGDGLGR